MPTISSRTGPAALSRLGVGMVEVLVALAILTAGFFPVYALLRENRLEAADAGTFLLLLERVHGRQAAIAPEPESGSISRDDLTAEEGPRSLCLKIVRVDQVGSFAPRTASATGEASP